MFNRTHFALIAPYSRTMNNPHLEADLADMRRKELEDWAKHERLVKAALRTRPAQPTVWSRWLAQLAKLTVIGPKASNPRRRSRKMHKAIPTLR